MYLEIVSDPRGQMLGPTKLPPLQMPVAGPRVCPMLLTNWIQMQVLAGPLLGLIHLRGELTELRVWGTICMNSQMAQIYKARYKNGFAAPAPSASVPPSTDCHTFSNLEALQTLFF
jgi:hypothetical protein